MCNIIGAAIYSTSSQVAEVNINLSEVFQNVPEIIPIEQLVSAAQSCCTPGGGCCKIT